MPITRRSLLAWMSSSTFFLSASTAARPQVGPAAAAQPALTSASFPQGVASADPQPDSIILWTRAAPLEASASGVQLQLEVSTDAAFSGPLLTWPVSSSADSDFTVRAHIEGLQPDTRYFYRFRGGQDTASRIGRTRTAPAPQAQRSARVAFASCQSYEQGHYGAWARMIAQDKQADEALQIDFVLHLGDFIYERCWHKRIDGTAQARRVPPFPDGITTKDNRYAVSLQDYRMLYKTYLEDPHLQEARARWPFVCTWDDHEYSNDNFQSYSNYNSTVKLDAPRKQVANQAWFEFIPAALDELQGQTAHGFREQPLGAGAAADNQAAVNSLRIYRKLSWGRYVDIVLTDSRSYRTAACLEDGLAESLGLPLATVELVEIADAGNTYNNHAPPQFLPYGDGTTANPGLDREPGTMLGLQQRDWLLDTLAQSGAHWKLWGNAIPLVPMRLDLSSLPFTDYQDSLVNIDSWAGYPHEVRTLMEGIAQRGASGVVSLSGDHHMHAAATVVPSLSEPLTAPVIADFAVAGISSSPVFDDLKAAADASHGAFSSLVYSQDATGITPVWNMSMLDGVLPAFLYANTSLKGPARWIGPNKANTGLQFVDVTANGYGIATFEAQQLHVQLVALEDCREDFTEPPAIRYTAHFKLPLWQAGQAPTLQGPTFQGTSPFPFDQSNT
jgi:alkaline phosphatase D